MILARPAQRAPRHDEPAADFPAVPFPVTNLRRAHSVGLGPWWFSNSGRGRFDLRPTEGTCYVADDVETATREHLRELVVDTQSVSSDRAEHFAVTTVRASLAGSMGDISDGRAQRHGVVRELSDTRDYDLAQEWARAFARSGFAGIRYASRFTSGLLPNAWARFGPAGEATAPEFEHTVRLSGTRACLQSGIHILRVPTTTAGLTIL